MKGQKTKLNSETFNIPQQEWKIKNINKQFMKDKGFKYYFRDKMYILTFPIYPLKNKNISGCFICKITIYEDTKEAFVDLYKNNESPQNIYAQFYNITNKAYTDFIKQLNNIILTKFKELGIYKKRKKYQRRINDK